MYCPAVPHNKDIFLYQSSLWFVAVWLSLWNLDHHYRIHVPRLQLGMDGYISLCSSVGEGKARLNMGTGGSASTGSAHPYLNHFKCKKPRTQLCH